VSRDTRAMPDPQHLDPGQLTPFAGYYRAHDVFGSPIEQVVPMREGEALPPLPKGFTWVLMEKW
jgi:hypothetical protein